MSQWRIDGDDAAELTGSNTTRLHHDHVLVKEPGTKERTPWHQDQPHYNVADVQNASMWFPVDRSTDQRPSNSSLGAVFFNMLTVHGSGGVMGVNRRRVLSVRFLGDDTS